MTDSIITAEKSVRVKLKVNVHHRRKYVETRGQKQNNLSATEIGHLASCGYHGTNVKRNRGKGPSA
ncbi:unnamed protein product [Acanthoscelides obtectus]|uniref:Uncharacterized protein n=1 Tax=Acanthoscelides obtectus TaxID=200917 RepID=A0A9P0M680_ACAOB|nr:unnamed protein product [Acanthoscelides obtectus]CAK1624181.1 hypothetical protein AOBTE_LOCUS2379 [Acanthoscelides obtectus]